MGGISRSDSSCNIGNLRASYTPLSHLGPSQTKASLSPEHLGDLTAFERSSSMHDAARRSHRLVVNSKLLQNVHFTKRKGYSTHPSKPDTPDRGPTRRVLSTSRFWERSHSTPPESGLISTRSLKQNPEHRRVRKVYQWSRSQEKHTSVAELLDRFKPYIKTKVRPTTTHSSRPIFARKMRPHIQFVTVPTADTPGTGLLLHFDNKRYFFGQMHEGLQRVTLQHGSKVLKARDIFLTGRTNIQTTGGLLGMILTIADNVKAAAESLKAARIAKTAARIRRAAEEEDRLRRKGKANLQPKSPPEEENFDAEPVHMNIYGAPNIMHTIAAARSFIFRQNMPLNVDEFLDNTERTGPESNWKPTWEDANIKVWAMPISPISRKGSISTAPGHQNGNEGPSDMLSRKRSHEDYIRGQQEEEEEEERGGGSAGGRGGSEPSEVLPDAEFGQREDQQEQQQQQQQLQQLRENVVHEMFRSGWRKDYLVPRKLADVQLPARIFVRDSDIEGKFRYYDGPLPNGVDPVPDIDVLLRQPWPGSLVPNLPAATRSATGLSYIVQNQEQRGKFLPDKARKLGVHPGPMFSQLTKGKSVILPDGRVVTPDQVMKPGKPGSGVAIIDLPTKDYVASLVRRKEWSQKNIMRGVEAFIWILGPGVYVHNDAKLTAFMKRFDHIQHIVSSPDLTSNQLMMVSAAQGAVRHHLIDPDRYSLLQHQNTPPTSSDDIAPDQSSFKKYVKATPGLILELEPSVQIDETEIYRPTDLETAFRDMPPEINSLAQAARSKIRAESTQDLPQDQQLPSPDAEIICLGTGSAIPSLYRNVAGTLLRVPGHGSYLFDAGENTLGQLKRIYSPQELSEVLRDLKMIWLSHLHADHHLGTATIIKEWHRVVHGDREPSGSQSPPVGEPNDENVAELLRDGPRLFVVGGSHMVRWLHEYSSVEDFGLQQVVPLETLPAGEASDRDETLLLWGLTNADFQSNKTDRSVREAMRAATGLENLEACFVDHCLGSMGVSVSFHDGFKFTYSGDCRPSRTLAMIGRGSTVLLHEATFDDERVADAEAKKHSTISEAIGVGMEMGAKRVILTHFSQRYQKIPTLNDLAGTTVRLGSADGGGREAEEGIGDEDQVPPIEDPDIDIEGDFSSNLPSYPPRKDAEDKNKLATTTPVRIQSNKDMKIAVAFDYMRVKVKDIASLEHFVPAFRTLYNSLESESGFADSRKLGLDKTSARREPRSEVVDGKGKANEAKKKDRKYKGTRSVIMKKQGG